MNLFKTIKKLFIKKEKEKIEDTENFIKNEFHFNNFHEELIDEIYTLLSKFGTVQVQKNSDEEFILVLKLEGSVKFYKVSFDGFETLPDLPKL